MKYDHAPLHDSSACQQRYKTCEHEQCRRYVHYADGWKEQIVVVVNICDGLFSSNVFRQIGYPVSECSHEKMQCRGGRDIQEPCVFDDAMAENYGEYGFGEDGEFDFDSILGIDQLDLNYEAHVAGFDGESFLYSVYFDGGVTDEKAEEIQQVMSGYSSQNGDEENYMGYIDIYKGEDQIMIYLDLGGVSEENSNMAVTGILNALNSVSGIKSVIINEEM